jgi:hypothetical protein
VQEDSVWVPFLSCRMPELLISNSQVLRRVKLFVGKSYVTWQTEIVVAGLWGFQRYDNAVIC